MRLLHLFKLLLCLCALNFATAAHAATKEDQIAEEAGVIAFLQKDYGKAYKLLPPLAERGFAKAQLYLGFMYMDGNGVPKDYDKGASFYEQAADQGNAIAQQVLGECLIIGPCLPRDVSRGIDLMTTAARSGQGAAMLSLAYIYKRGEGVPKDYVLALKWFNLAAASFSGWAEYRDEMEGKMTPAQIAEAQKLAREWKRK
jgi:TPR repeat protein